MAPGEGAETQPNQLCCGEGGKERPAAARPCAGRDPGDTAAPGSRRSLKTRGARRQSWCSLLFDSCKAPAARQRNHQSKRERWIPPPISQGTICTLFSFSKHSGFTDEWFYSVRIWMKELGSYVTQFPDVKKNTKKHNIFLKVWQNQQVPPLLYPHSCHPVWWRACTTENPAWHTKRNVTTTRLQTNTANGSNSSQSPGPQQQPLLYRVKKPWLSRVCWIPGLDPAAGDLPLAWQPWAHRSNTAIQERHHCHTHVTNASVQAHSFYKASICQQKNRHNCIFSTKLLAHAKILTCDSTSATLVAYCS